MIRKFLDILIMTVVVFTMMSTTAFTTNQSLTNIDAPQNLSVEVKEQENKQPYFYLKWNNPQSIIEHVENGEEIYYQVDCKVGDGKWNYEVIGDFLPGNGLFFVDDETLDQCFAPYDPINEGELDTIDIKSNVYYFRIRYSCLSYSDDTGDHWIYSSFSNVIEIGSPEFYKGASSWAKPELDKAAKHGLITDKIKDNMNGPITREEFAELATRLYEVYTGKTAETAPLSTFSDTTNPEILKANKLGIVNGVGNNKFDPKALTNREQIAAMLNRAVGVIKPTADLSIEGAPVFADENEVASYFIDSVKFMAKNGFITGVGDNRFDPKEQCTREQAVLIAVRVYEAYK